MLLSRVEKRHRKALQVARSGLKVEAFDIGKRGSSADVVFDALRDAIIRGQLAEGEILRQDTIAQMFNVSRIPVREALQRLEAQGLVTATRYKGVVVTPMSVAEIQEIFEFRALLEPHVIAFAVPQMTEESLAYARACCDAFATETQPTHWGDLNRQFHSALYADARRPYFMSVIDKTKDRVDRYVRAILELANGMETARREHKAILDACLARDAAAAADLTRQHIVNAGETLSAFLTAAGR
jgi:DNA-binding GntR family transcriptional regulator